MFSPRKPLRTLSVFDHGSRYTILDNDSTDDAAATPLYTIHWTPNAAPHMTAYRGNDNERQVAGSATYHANKQLGFAKASHITLKLPASGTVSLNKEGNSLFSTDKRTLRSAVLGQVYWKGGYSLSGFLKLVDGDGKSLVEYKGLRVGGRLGTLEFRVELGDEGLDEVIVSGMAMLSESMTSMANTAGALAVAS